MRDATPLFNDRDFSAIVRATPGILAQKIDNELDDRTLMRDDQDALIDELVRQHMPTIPTLHPDKVTTDEGEVEVDVGRDWDRFNPGGGPIYKKVAEYRFYLPYTGEREVFACSPNRFGGARPYADVGDRELTIRVLRRNEKQDAAAIRKDFEQTVALIEQHLGWLREEMKGLEDTLRQAARTRLEKRRDKRKNDAALIDQIGFPKRSPAHERR